MRKLLYIFSYSVYLFVLIGLFFHTSSSPQVLGKYTYKYAFILAALSFFFPAFLYLVYYLTKKSTFRIKKRKIVFDPFRKLAVLILAILIIVVPAELLLREKYKDFESNAYLHTIENFDPFLQSKIAGHENLVVNNMGFRGEDIQPEKSDNTFRIFVLGGSTVLNREVEFEKNAVRLLENKLRNTFPTKQIEVVNAGKDFYTTEHSIIQYLFKISDLEPDLIIMWHGANDMGMSCTEDGLNALGDYKPDYSHYFGPLSNIIFDYFRPQPVLQIKLITADFILKALKDNLYSDLLVPLREKSKEDFAKSFLNNKNTVSVAEFPSLESYSRNLKSLIKITKADGVPLILGDQPTLIKSGNTVSEVMSVIGPGLACRKDGKFYDLASLKNGLDTFNEEAKKVAEENEVMFVQLDKAIPKTLDYFTDAFHFTEEGNILVADSLFELIVSRNLIY